MTVIRMTLLLERVRPLFGKASGDAERRLTIIWADVKAEALSRKQQFQAQFALSAMTLRADFSAALLDRAV